MYTRPVIISRSQTISIGACQRFCGIQRSSTAYRIASAYHTTISGTNWSAAIESSEYSRNSTTIANTSVMIRKRTRVSHASH
ncbi:MAG: hypothetical protein ABSA32_09255 [Candidatus Acidiferrales bacterium]